jgi:hypothetical protein
MTRGLRNEGPVLGINTAVGEGKCFENCEAIFTDCGGLGAQPPGEGGSGRPAQAGLERGGRLSPLLLTWVKIFVEGKGAAILFADVPCNYWNYGIYFSYKSEISAY